MHKSTISHTATHTRSLCLASTLQFSFQFSETQNSCKTCTQHCDCAAVGTRPAFACTATFKNLIKTLPAFGFIFEIRFASSVVAALRPFIKKKKIQLTRRHTDKQYPIAKRIAEQTNSEFEFIVVRFLSMRPSVSQPHSIALHWHREREKKEK